jgi:ketosteroid isomerase-like protein
MSRANVEAIERGFRRYLETGESDMRPFDSEVEVRDHDIPDAGDYRGHSGYFRWLEDWAAAWQSFSLDPREFIDAGDSVLVVVRLRARGRGSGVEVDREDGLVYTLRDGMIVRLDYYGSKVEALDAVGLAE